MEQHRRIIDRIAADITTADWSDLAARQIPAEAVK